MLKNFSQYHKLNESKLDQYRETYVGKGVLDDVTFDDLASADEHPYVMLPWMVKTYKALKDRPDMVKEIKNLVKQFKEYKQSLPNKDINYYDYSTMLSELSKIKADRLYKQVDKIDGAEMVLEVGTKKLYKIYTMQAAQKYGASTKWCISATSTQNMWNNYKRLNIFYFLIDSNPASKNLEKVAIQVKKPTELKRKNVDLDITYWNAIDNTISYRLPSVMKNYINDNINDPNYLAMTDVKQKEKEKETRTVKNLAVKAEQEMIAVIDPAFYLKDNLDVPKDMLSKAVDVDLRFSHVTTLRNLKMTKDLILNDCKELISLGNLETVEHFGDFRGCSNVKQFDKLKFVSESYVDVDTSKELISKLKEVSKEFIEV